MKKYPYTESTDLIIYDQKPKKEKKQKVCDDADYNGYDFRAGQKQIFYCSASESECDSGN